MDPDSCVRVWHCETMLYSHTVKTETYPQSGSTCMPWRRPISLDSAGVNISLVLRPFPPPVFEGHSKSRNGKWEMRNGEMKKWGNGDSNDTVLRHNR